MQLFNYLKKSKACLSVLMQTYLPGKCKFQNSVKIHCHLEGVEYIR
jgi:hypothetical protein